MLRLIYILLLMLVFQYSQAQVEVSGPYIGTTFTTTNTTIRTWWAPERAGVSDDWHTTAVNMEGGTTSDTLIISNFTINMPDTAIIKGIEVSIDKSDLQNSGNIRDELIQLIYAPQGIISSNKKDNRSWSGTDEAIVYGGSSDTWGVSWTVAQIKSSQFKLLIKAAKDGELSGVGKPGVDYVTIKIYYTLPEPPPPPDPDPVPTPEKVFVYPLMNVPESTVNISEQGYARIYNIEGQLIKEFPTPAIWDATDTSGLVVPVGEYYIIINESKEIRAIVIK